MAKYKTGQSGNPKGRPPGVRDKRHDLRDQLKAHAPELVARAIQMAMDGDPQAMRLCLERCLPAIRPTSETISFPVSTNTLTGMGESILKATAAGEIPPDTAHQLISALAAQARIVEIDELERRLRELEQKKDDPPDEEYL